MFIGEAPGKNEDLKGEPFVGAAGKLLNELLARGGADARRGLHRQRAQVPAAGQPRPRARRDRDVHAVPARADPRHRARGARHAGQLRDEVRAQDRDRHHAAARHGAARRDGSRCCRSSIRRPRIYDRTQARRRSSPTSRLLRDAARPSEADGATRRRARPSPARPRCSSERAAPCPTSHRSRPTSEAATQAVGRALAPLRRLPGDVLVLSGDLGAGKTQLTKGIAAGLGVAEPVTSPTFNILLVHEGRIPLYHFDLYRLERRRAARGHRLLGHARGRRRLGRRVGRPLRRGGARATCVVVRIHITGDDARDARARAARRARRGARRGVGAALRGVAGVGVAAEASAREPDSARARHRDRASPRSASRGSATSALEVLGSAVVDAPRAAMSRLLPMAESLLAAQRPRRSRTSAA